MIFCRPYFYWLSSFLPADRSIISSDYPEPAPVEVPAIKKFHMDGCISMHASSAQYQIYTAVKCTVP